MDDLPVSGIDAEWNIYHGPGERVVGHGPIAVMWIAYQKEILVLQIRKYVESKSLPQQLIIFLHEKHIIKVICGVNHDLQALAKEAGCDTFSGGLELSSFAKEHFLISEACASLEDLTAVLLHQCLKKNNGECISSNWNEEQLTSAQLCYAAIDVYVSLVLYNKINSSSTPEPVSETAPDGTKVVILSADHRKVVAHDILLPTSVQQVEKLNITPS
ncbi:hypothetical protein D9758_013482 [Tetrapyrgos nigripes]|uniref:3'-5' exonuclease n=1 Tax=Tetrapyrgos nigripes TaxID=182062 RepID=A0A8H5FRZ7_9AGAR|nr:hypothetical protein D9758_013482 [Tetrapyrgos nigripes]